MTPLANILQPLIDPLNWLLVQLNDLGLGWGLSIIALTVIVRILLLPLTLKQFKSMQALQRFAPEIKALQEKYKHDRQRQQQEMMKFYQENQINPFASCLPLLLQMPFFIALFYALREDVRMDICGQVEVPCGQIPGDQGESFLFIADLTDKATGGVLIFLIVLYVASQLLSSVLLAVTADRNQRMIMTALPFIFVPFIIQFPSGLLVYWITTNLWTVGQQYVIRRSAGVPVLGAPGDPSKAPPPLPSFGAKKEAPSGNGASPAAKRGGPPPPPPRQKKKRSGRRR
jgi:YidC/Oxa1 family membrane protein insertase